MDVSGWNSLKIEKRYLAMPIRTSVMICRSRKTKKIKKTIPTVPDT